MFLINNTHKQKEKKNEIVLNLNQEKECIDKTIEHNRVEYLLFTLQSNSNHYDSLSTRRHQTSEINLLNLVSKPHLITISAPQSESFTKLQGFWIFHWKCIHKKSPFLSLSLFLLWVNPSRALPYKRVSIC